MSKDATGALTKEEERKIDESHERYRRELQELRSRFLQEKRARETWLLLKEHFLKNGSLFKR